MSDNIIKYLDNKYLKNKFFQKTVSSHWLNYNNRYFQKKNSDFHRYLSGGICTFNIKNNKNLLYSYPLSIYLYYLMFKYKIDKKNIKTLLSLSNNLKIYPSFDQYKLLIIIEKINMHIDLGKVKSFGIIGDGYGFLGALLNKLYPESNIVFINIGENLLLDYFYFNKINNEKKILIKNMNFDKQSNFYFIESDNYKLIQNLEIDFFFNIASMQEMNNETIRNYFNYIRNNKNDYQYFYCCNRNEKLLPDGEIINFKNFPWKKTDIVYFDEKADFYKYFPTILPPFLKKFNGVILNKLVKFV